MAEVDKNQDGEISFEEFGQMTGFTADSMLKLEKSRMKILLKFWIKKEY